MQSSIEDLAHVPEIVVKEGEIVAKEIIDVLVTV